MPSIGANTHINPPLHGRLDAMMNHWKIPDCFATSHYKVSEGAYNVHWGCIHNSPTRSIISIHVFTYLLSPFSFVNASISVLETSVDDGLDNVLTDSETGENYSISVARRGLIPVVPVHSPGLWSTTRLPPTRTGFDSRRGRSRIFACGNRIRRCRRSEAFLGDLPFPPPHHSGAAPYSSRFTLIRSQDLDVKSSLNLFLWLFLLVKPFTLIKRPERTFARPVCRSINFRSSCVYTNIRSLGNARSPSEKCAFKRQEIIHSRLLPNFLKTPAKDLLPGYSSRSPPTKAIRVQSPTGSLRIFACGNRAGRCQDLPFSSPFHSGTTPFLPHFTLIGSQDLDIKSRPNLFTLLGLGKNQDFVMGEFSIGKYSTASYNCTVFASHAEHDRPLSSLEKRAIPPVLWLDWSRTYPHAPHCIPAIFPPTLTSPHSRASELEDWPVARAQTFRSRLGRIAPAKPARIVDSGSLPHVHKWESRRMLPLISEFPRGSPVFSPPFHSGAASYSSRSTVIGSQEPDVKSNQNLFVTLHSY
ncbi:hypothetical protein PR048_010318 [Dryococelus australis]|uniref:Uncharacterized protein n=1 Tax=Dryococelus australis TaxID=614101 RepID=A0ABQ9I2E9_9NEOP|nr:hypothetical protein PR048_010318 [Dryococelus australis]